VPVESFSIDYYWKHGDSVFWNNQLPKFRTNPTPAIKDVDINSFVIGKGNYYAKDKNQAFYPIGISGVCDDSIFDGRTFVQIIPYADPVTFEVLGDGFAIDKNHMYFMGEEIPYNNNASSG